MRSAVCLAALVVSSLVSQLALAQIPDFKGVPQPELPRAYFASLLLADPATSTGSVQITGGPITLSWITTILNNGRTIESMNQTGSNTTTGYTDYGTGEARSEFFSTAQQSNFTNGFYTTDCSPILANTMAVTGSGTFDVNDGLPMVYSQDPTCVTSGALWMIANSDPISLVGLGILNNANPYAYVDPSNNQWSGFGDFDYNGAIDPDDLVVFLSVFRPTTLVPEPSSVLLLALGFGGLFGLARCRNLAC